MEEAPALGAGEQDYSVVDDALRRRGRPRARAALARGRRRAAVRRRVEGTERELQADLVLLAMGFLHPEHEGSSTQLGVDLDARGNVKAGDLRDVASPASSRPATPAAASR